MLSSPPHPTPTQPHPTPWCCVAPTMCASVRNMMLRSTNHVCKCKERYHPHPTPPPTSCVASTMSTAGEPPVPRVTLYTFSETIAECRCRKSLAELLIQVLAGIQESIFLCSQQYLKTEHSWTSNSSFLTLHLHANQSMKLQASARCRSAEDKVNSPEGLIPDQDVNNFFVKIVWKSCFFSLFRLAWGPAPDKWASGHKSNSVPVLEGSLSVPNGHDFCQELQAYAKDASRRAERCDALEAEMAEMKERLQRELLRRSEEIALEQKLQSAQKAAEERAEKAILRSEFAEQRATAAEKKSQIWRCKWLPQPPIWRIQQLRFKWLKLRKTDALKRQRLRKPKWLRSWRDLVNRKLKNRPCKSKPKQALSYGANWQMLHSSKKNLWPKRSKMKNGVRIWCSKLQDWRHTLAILMKWKRQDRQR